MEVETLEDGLKFASMGADILQFDKMTLIKLYDAVPEIRTQYPHIILIATGGISRKNIVEYSSTGVDIIVTSSPYNAPPADIKVVIEPL